METIEVNDNEIKIYLKEFFEGMEKRLDFSEKILTEDPELSLIFPFILIDSLAGIKFPKGKGKGYAKFLQMYGGDAWTADIRNCNYII